MEEGKYYCLTADVKNPCPNRRKKQLDCVDVWPAGTVVRVRYVYGDVGVIVFSDGWSILFNLDQKTNHLASERQGNGIIKAIEPAPLSLWQILQQSDWTPTELLARMIDLGKITLEDLDSEKQFDVPTEEEAINFRKKHGLIQ